MRMCVGCRERKPKRELVRVVRTPQGEILVDGTGKKSGRGTYVCIGSDGCLAKAIKTRALERALESPISQEIYQALQEQLAMHEVVNDEPE